MKKIKYHLYYKNNHYVLLNLSDKTYIRSLGFFYIYQHIKEHNIPFDSVGMPRMNLYKLFRDYCSFDNEGDTKI